MFLEVIRMVFDCTAAWFWVQPLGGQSFHVLPVSGVGFLTATSVPPLHQTQHILWLGFHDSFLQNKSDI